METENLFKNFADNLKYHMQEKGITQVKLAQAVNVTQPAVSLWLLGKSEPSFIKICLILKCLNITFEELIE